MKKKMLCVLFALIMVLSLVLCGCDSVVNAGNGTQQNGTQQNGTQQNGTQQNGTQQNGTQQNGTQQNG